MSVRSRSNWNLKVLVFKERGIPEYREKNLSGQGRELTTNSTHIWRRRKDSNPDHIGGRRVLSPLRHLCSPPPLRDRFDLFVANCGSQSYWITDLLSNVQICLLDSLQAFPVGTPKMTASPVKRLRSCSISFTICYKMFQWGTLWHLCLELNSKRLQKNKNNIFFWCQHPP